VPLAGVVAGRSAICAPSRTNRDIHVALNLSLQSGSTVYANLIDQAIEVTISQILSPSNRRGLVMR